MSLVIGSTSVSLKWKTPESWTQMCLDNLDLFLIDHASCERKAHAASLMIANKYFEDIELQKVMVDLAKEELEHFSQVLELLHRRGLFLIKDEIDVYVKSLLTHVRHPKDEHLLDRLLVVAIVEARSAERFEMISQGLPPGDLKDFYLKFSEDEARHAPLFVGQAKRKFGAALAESRLAELIDIEADIQVSLPLRVGVH